MADPFAQFADAPQDGFAQFQDAPTQNQLDSTRQSTIGGSQDNVVTDLSSGTVDERVKAFKKQASEQLGGPVDFEKGASFGLRADLSLSNTDEEKLAKIKARFPEGDLKRVQTDVPGFTNGELFFRKSPNEPFTIVDPDRPDLGDIADLAGSAPAIAGAVAGGLSPAGLVASAIKVGIGAFAGNEIAQETERLRGFQKDSPLAVAGQSALEGGLAATGQAGGRIVSGVLGKGTVRLAPEQKQMVKAATELDTHLTPGQVSQNPFVRQAEGITGRLSPTVERQRAAQQLKIFQAVEEKKQALGGLDIVDSAKKLKKDIGPKLIDSTKQEIDSLGKDLIGKEQSLLSSGRGIQEGFSTFRTRVNETASRLYTRLDEIAANRKVDIQIKLDRIKQAASESETPIFGKTATGKDIPVSDTLDTGVKQLIDDIQQLGGNQSLTVLRALRERAIKLADHPADVLPSKSNFVASNLRRSIDDALNKDFVIPDPQVLSAYRRASSFFRAKQQRLENKVIKSFVRTSTPDEILGTLLRPNRSARLLTVRNSLPKDKWEQVRDSFKGRLLDNPAGIQKELTRFGKQTREILLNKNELKSFKQIGEQYNILTKSPLFKVVQGSMNQGRFLGTRFDANKTEEALQFMEQLGGKTSEGGTTARAGFMGTLLAASSKVEAGGVVKFNGKALGSILDKMRESGIDKAVLTENDLKLLTNIRDIASTESAQVGLVGAGLVSKVINDVTSASGKLLYYGLLGKMITSKTLSRFLFGDGLKTQSDIITVFARTLTQINGDLRKDFSKGVRSGKIPLGNQ